MKVFSIQIYTIKKMVGVMWGLCYDEEASLY